MNFDLEKSIADEIDRRKKEIMQIIDHEKKQKQKFFHENMKDLTKRDRVKKFNWLESLQKNEDKKIFKGLKRISDYEKKKEYSKNSLPASQIQNTK